MVKAYFRASLKGNLIDTFVLMTITDWGPSRTDGFISQYFIPIDVISLSAPGKLLLCLCLQSLKYKLFCI